MHQEIFFSLNVCADERSAKGLPAFRAHQSKDMMNPKICKRQTRHTHKERVFTTSATTTKAQRNSKSQMSLEQHPVAFRVCVFGACNHLMEKYSDIALVSISDDEFRRPKGLAVELAR
jgi:hypothetical protein